MNWSLIVNTDTLVIALVTLTVFTGLIAAEMLWPRRKPQQSWTWTWRWLNNLSLGAITWLSATMAGYAFGLLLSSWTQANRLGLFQQFDAGFWLPFFSLLLLTQFLSYVTHRAFHEIAWLWPLHAVHHSDTDVDCSTSYRHHPLEPLVFIPVVMPLVLLLGVGPAALFAFYIVRIVLTVFSHGNVFLPAAVDSVLCRIIVTPDFHRLHHSSDPNFTNSNYGSLVPWFDYLFGTAKACEFHRHEDMDLGLEYKRQRRDSRIDRMIFSLPRPERSSQVNRHAG